jgi:hypothetical protein
MNSSSAAQARGPSSSCSGQSHQRIRRDSFLRSLVHPDALSIRSSLTSQKCLARLSGFAGCEGIKWLIQHELTPKGLHYTSVAAAA